MGFNEEIVKETISMLKPGGSGMFVVPTDTGDDFSNISKQTPLLGFRHPSNGS
jgi:hypothetical protein